MQKSDKKSYPVIANPRLVNSGAGASHETKQKGLVVSSFGSCVVIETKEGEMIQCSLRRNQDTPVVGDEVEWCVENKTGSILSIQLRRSLLMRGDQHGKKKILAANIDAILVVMAPLPIISNQLIDCYLIAAELLGIQAMIVLNKMDLLTDKNEINERLVSYRHMAYPVIFSSAITAHGLDDLALHLKGKRVVLMGPSGVGKSSIIASFCKGKPIRIGDVSSKGIGKHTTTTTQLYHLPFGGEVIDSPGVREFHLWQLSKEDILQGFKEFQDYLGGCKFRDCQHLAEPGCLIKIAVEAGKLSASRYESYQTMIKNLRTR